MPTVGAPAAQAPAAAAHAAVRTAPLPARDSDGGTGWALAAALAALASVAVLLLGYLDIL